MRKIIAIDFDGCLVENRWPEIGEPKQDVIDAALREQKEGAALILWTCRTGRHLTEAVTFCHALGLDFDAINDNLPDLVKAYDGSNCRKVVATEYWDDHAVRMPAPKSLSVEAAAELLYAALGYDECACNFNGIDEWLPFFCKYSKDGTCPDPEGYLACWIQFIKNYHGKELTRE